MGTLFEIIIDFFLIREDYLHRKKIKKKEKLSFFSKISPSFIITLISALILFLLFSIYQYYLHVRVKPEKTKDEIILISHKIKKWKEKYHRFPANLKELIKNNPNRLEWEKDAWNISYHYGIENNGESFFIISSGKDKKLNTDDDITFNSSIQ